MKKEELTDVLSRIDERFIEEAAMYVPANTSSVKMKREPSLLKVSLLAACFAIIVVLGISIPSFVAEARAYNTAVAFFEDNHLSMEGLTRADVTAVYRDFSTQGFSSEKMVDILWQSVPEFEILP